MGRSRRESFSAVSLVARKKTHCNQNAILYHTLLLFYSQLEDRESEEIMSSLSDRTVAAFSSFCTAFALEDEIQDTDSAFKAMIGVCVDPKIANGEKILSEVVGLSDETIESVCCNKNYSAYSGGNYSIDGSMWNEVFCKSSICEIDKCVRKSLLYRDIKKEMCACCGGYGIDAKTMDNISITLFFLLGASPSVAKCAIRTPCWPWSNNKRLEDCVWEVYCSFRNGVSCRILTEEYCKVLKCITFPKCSLCHGVSDGFASSCKPKPLCRPKPPCREKPVCLSKTVCCPKGKPQIRYVPLYNGKSKCMALALPRPVAKEPFPCGKCPPKEKKKECAPCDPCPPETWEPLYPCLPECPPTSCSKGWRSICSDVAQIEFEAEDDIGIASNKTIQNFREGVGIPRHYNKNDLLALFLITSLAEDEHFDSKMVELHIGDRMHEKMREMRDADRFGSFLLEMNNEDWASLVETLAKNEQSSNVTLFGPDSLHSYLEEHSTTNKEQSGDIVLKYVTAHLPGWQDKWTKCGWPLGREEFDAVKDYLLESKGVSQDVGTTICSMV
jgi:hypothetical protein